VPYFAPALNLCGNYSQALTPSICLVTSDAHIKFTLLGSQVSGRLSSTGITEWPDKPPFVHDVSFYKPRPPPEVKAAEVDRNITVPLCVGPVSECIIIITVIDDAYGLRKKYGPMTTSVSCYAKRHGYGYMQVNPNKYNKNCHSMRDFFFKKHCAIHQMMVTGALRKNAALLVLDGDIAAANVDSTLTKYLKDGADVVVYVYL